MAWSRSGSSRTASSAITTSARWRRVRAQVLARDGGVCQLRLTGCVGVATEVDKIVPVARGGNPLDPANLRAVCPPCHRVKTAQDAAAGRVSERRPLERHPGLVDL